MEEQYFWMTERQTVRKTKTNDTQAKFSGCYKKIS